ncbi:MAG: tetratricopeptide repeat protein, partial [Candidatus Thorarchaeota archaeon]
GFISLGLINEEVGYYDQAIYHFDSAINILDLLGDNQKLVQVFNNIGNVYNILNDLEQSYNYYQKALNLAENENLELEAVKTSSNLVEVLFSLKDYDRILRILKNNLDFFSANHDLYGTVLTLLKFGKVYYHLGEGYYDQAHNYLNDTLALIKRIDAQLSRATKARLEWECFLYIAKLNILWDNDNEAEDYLLKSLEIIRTYEIQDHINEALVLENIANFHSIKGDDKKAIEYFMLAIEIYTKYGNKVKIAEIQKEIGTIFKEYIQDIEKAKTFFESALEIYEAEHYFKQSATILQILGDIFTKENNLDLAKTFYEKASKYYSEINDEYNNSIITQKLKSLLEFKKDS